MKRQTFIGLMVAGILAMAPLAAFGCDDGSSDLITDNGSYQLTILKTGSGLVETHPGGFHCKNDTCTVTYQGVHNVTLTGMSANGETVRFEANKCNGASQCTVTLDRDMTISIHFEAKAEDQGQSGDIGC